MEYRIEVTLTPNEECPNALYFWYIKYRNIRAWCNGGHGWAVTPEKAWEAAIEYYKKNYLEN